MGKYELQLLQVRYYAGSQGDDTHSPNVTSLDIRVLKMEEFIDDTSRQHLRASGHFPQHRVVQEVSFKKVTLVEFPGIIFYRVPANDGIDLVVAAASVIPVVSSNLNPAKIVTRLQNTNNEKLQRVDAPCVNSCSPCSNNFGGEDAVVAASSKSGLLDMGLGTILGIIAPCEEATAFGPRLGSSLLQHVWSFPSLCSPHRIPVLVWVSAGFRN
uniref:Uncharacterized protein n=1 Tax=Proboscia inermis TaxID=420281 RepID=A0A7S0CF06_9STRA|mmetsp:Transcript_43602/g.44123  ORF Transcript_43602/g.44123 Transcript_43602/m.44123 type:complete len:213 (+) Transcript_43602:255-893(+)